MIKANSKKNKLNIVMPAYNAKNTIKRAIDSVLNLLNDQELETKLIIVDDFSSDETFEIINQNYSRFFNLSIYKNIKNEGPGKSRNFAIEKIEDGYIGFIDSDDEIDPLLYKKAFLDGLNKNADLITFNGLTVMPKRSSLRYDYDRISHSKYDLVRNCIRGDLDGSVIFSIYKKSMLDNFGIRFSSNYYEDIIFNYSALMSSRKIHIANEICYKKYDTTQSILNSISEKHIDGMIDASLMVKDFAIRNGYSKYEEFKSDSDYSLCGYIATSVIGILKNEKNIVQSIALLNYLYNKLEYCYKIKNIVLRTETRKDKLSNFFLSKYDPTRPYTTINELKMIIGI